MAFRFRASATSLRVRCHRRCSLMTTTIRRPFHWGIVVVDAEGSAARLPDMAPGKLVTATEHEFVVLVRLAQDVESFDDDFDLAEVAVTVRQLAAPMASASRRVVVQGSVRAPSGQISIGDADAWVTVPAHHGTNAVVVCVGATLPDTKMAPDAIHVDLSPYYDKVRTFTEEAT